MAPVLDPWMTELHRRGASPPVARLLGVPYSQPYTFSGLSAGQLGLPPRPVRS